MIRSSPAAGGVRPRRPLPGASILTALLLGLLGCSPPAGPAPPEGAGGPAWFEDVTDAVGLDFVHDPGPTGSYFMPQVMGSGGAFLRDGDGTLYLYLLQDAGPDSKSVNRLYRRLPNGKFADVTAGSGLGVAGYGMGVAVGDVNNDGLPDVLLTEYGRIRLFLNRGGGRFEDVTEEAGLSDPLWAASAAFLDYDRDGLLDLVVINYKDYDPKKECYSLQGMRDYCSPIHFADVSSLQLGDYGRGPPLLREAVRLDPDNAQAHYALALAQFRRAEKEWQGSPGSAEAREWFREALEQARRAAELKPDHAQAYLFWGLSLKYLGRPAEAVAPLRKGVACRPENLDLQLALGEALLESGQGREAETYLENARRLDPNDPRPARDLQRLHDQKR